MDLELAGKRALITGGSRGIGLAIARQLALEGARVVLAARDAERLATAAAALAAETGAEVHGLAVDTGDDASVKALVGESVARLGGLDVLVNSAAMPAGQSAPPKLDAVTDAVFWDDVNTKVMGYLRCAREAAPHMAAQGWGRIINISGLNARTGSSIVGAIRNVGVAALTKTLADELGGAGINVTVVHPGLTRTEKTAGVIAARAKASGQSEAQVERAMAANVVIGRIVDAREVADVVAFLASPRSVAITATPSPAAADGKARSTIEDTQKEQTMDDHPPAIRPYERYEALKFSLEDGVMTVTLSNPARKNALTPKMLDELKTVWHDLAGDPAVQVIVLTGEGRDFCAGADLSQIGEITGRGGGKSGGEAEHARGHVDQPHVLYVLDCPKPTLAKVRGVAYGLGVNLALACDMVFVSEEARLCDSHIKAGMVAGDGGVLLWPLLVGMHRAKEYLMTGEPIPGPAAAEMGLVNRCVPADLLDAEVEAMAGKLRALPPIAVNRTKMALNLAMRQMTGPAFETSHAWELLSMTSEDFGEATRAFVEKRQGVYTGR